MGAFLGVALFTFNEDPPMSLLIISAVDIIGFVPTVRKTMTRPYQETLSTFAITSLKYVFSIAALENYTFLTVYYPSVVGTMNALFVILLIVQRKRIGPPKKAAKPVQHRT
jgi:Trk-type K+ transport system membrane component